VSQWILRLHSHERCSGVIHDLLYLVQNRLLVISAKKRITSAMLVAELRKLAERAETDPKTENDTGSGVRDSPTYPVGTAELEKPVSMAVQSTSECSSLPPRKPFDSDSLIVLVGSVNHCETLWIYSHYHLARSSLSIA